ncbi:MAG: hypothetical protein Q9226_002931 [Calogaya cf. arnoldii]
MHTGAVPAQALGLNTKKPFEFIWRATCAPLTINETFLFRAMDENNTQLGYAYFYGKSSPSVQHKNLTWATFTARNWDNEGTTPSYEFQNFSTGGPRGVFKPTPQLEVDHNKVLTLIHNGTFEWLRMAFDPGKATMGESRKARGRIGVTPYFSRQLAYVPVYYQIHSAPLDKE